jgi:hypothetical protein
MAEKQAPVATFPSRPKNFDSMYYSHTESPSDSSFQQNAIRQQQRNVIQRNEHLQQGAQADISGKGLSSKHLPTAQSQDSHSSRDPDLPIHINNRDQSVNSETLGHKPPHNPTNLGGDGDGDGSGAGPSWDKPAPKPEKVDPFYFRQAKPLEFAVYATKASHQAWLNGIMRKCHDHPEIKHCVFAKKNIKGHMERNFIDPIPYDVQEKLYDALFEALPTKIFNDIATADAITYSLGQDILKRLNE